MSRNNRRHIAEFDQVASDKDTGNKDVVITDNNPETNISGDTIVNNDNNPVNNTEINNDSNIVVTTDIDNSINHNVNHNNAIDNILNAEKSKSTRIQRGLYLDRDIDAVLTKLLKKGGKGAKSDVINDVLRAAFESRGLLK